MFRLRCSPKRFAEFAESRVSQYMFRQFSICAFVLSFFLSANASTAHSFIVRDASDQQETRQRSAVAVLDFGETTIGVRVADRIRAQLSRRTEFSMIDREQAGAAARGANYAGSLNLTLNEARALGASIGCDYLIVGRAETVRRSRSDNQTYYEAIAAIFVVSARTGKLLMWDSVNEEAASEEAAERVLLGDRTFAHAERCRIIINRAREDEEIARRRAMQETGAVAFEELPEENSLAAQEFRAPQPFRRISPTYTDAARRAEVEATVDVIVEIDTSGEVNRVEIVRWAGFGLDEAIIEAVHAMHFRPAMRAGVPVPVRVLLRYNFRRPSATERAGGSGTL